MFIMEKKKKIDDGSNGNERIIIIYIYINFDLMHARASKLVYFKRK